MIDGAIIIFSLLFAFWLRFYSGLIPLRTAPPISSYLKLIVFVTIGWSFLFHILGLYQRQDFPSLTREFISIFKGIFWGIIFLLAGTFFYRGLEYSRLVIGLGSIFSFLLLLLFHFLFFRLRIHFLRKRKGKGVLIVGAGRDGRIIGQRLLRHPELGNLIGFLDDNQKGKAGGITILGKTDTLERFLKNFSSPEAVIIALPFKFREKIKELVKVCEKEKKKVYLLPDFYELFFSGVETTTFAGLPLLNLKESPLSLPVNRFLKGLLDFFFGLLITVILIPFFLIVSLLIKFTSKGSPFFRQERVGLGGKAFLIYKFRTMRGEGGPAWTEHNDHRLTKIGKFLRRYNFDELPQLFNVLKGEMSLVGPRPIAVKDEEFFRLPYFFKREEIKPGITGWAQINGLRGGHIEPEERLRYDLYYIENWSFWLDLTILLQSPFSLRNAF